MIIIIKSHYSAKNLLRTFNDGELNFDLPMQRGYVWARDKKSKLISSPLEGFPIPALYANKVGKVFRIIDGQQRGKTIISFLQNKFSLLELPPIEINGTIYHVSGKKFNELPEELQEIISDCNLDLYYGENLSESQEKEMFIRLNNGKPLSATEMTKAQIKSMVEVGALAQHSAFKKIINEKGLEASKNASLVMQTYVALFEPNKCMLAAAVKRALGGTQISDIQREHIRECLDVFEQAYESFSHDRTDISKKLTLIFKRKSHFIAFMYTVSQAMQSKDFDIKILIDWRKHFFDCEVDQTTICNEYNSCLKESMNSNESVTTRLLSMFNDYQRYVERSKEAAYEQN